MSGLYFFNLLNILCLWYGGCVLVYAIACVRSQLCGVSSRYQTQVIRLSWQGLLARASLLLGLSPRGTNTPEQCRAFFVDSPGAALLSDCNSMLTVHLCSQLFI